jgi:hypothetical protein
MLDRLLSYVGRIMNVRMNMMIEEEYVRILKKKKKIRRYVQKTSDTKV